MMNVYLFPEKPAVSRFPLQRYLPPLPEGMAARFLADQGLEGEFIVDVFGASPQMLIEAGAAGCTVLVSSSNPVLRFLIYHSANPFSRELLQKALTRMGNLPKDGERMEQFLQHLYRSRCEHCGAEVTADSFTWEAGMDVPSHKYYSCFSCGFEGEARADVEDARLAVELAGYPQHREMILARITPSDNAFRQHAAEVLGIYSPRALIAVNLLLNKMDQLELEEDLEQALKALLLATFDRCSLLWSFPAGSRPRPLQLSLSPRFTEFNVWKALTWSVEQWTLGCSGTQAVWWHPGDEVSAGRIHIYPGSAKGLQPFLYRNPPKAVLSVLPRPNQAFWLLSALWSTWIMAGDESRSFNRTLLRRRYDWEWYTGALQTALSGYADVLSDQRVLGVILEAEPAFTGAVYAGFRAAGFQTASSFLDEDHSSAAVEWKPCSAQGISSVMDSRNLAEFLAAVLRERGEPARFFRLAEAGQFFLAQIPDPAGYHNPAPAVLASHQALLEAALSDQKIFLRLDQNLELESGVFWLKVAEGAEEPLGDRVEKEVYRILTDTERIGETDLIKQIYESFPPLQLPASQTVRSAVRAYADFLEGTWVLRPEELPVNRSADNTEMRQLLCTLGEKFGFNVETGEEIRWHDEKGLQWIFHVSIHASLGPILAHQGHAHRCVVCPGSRAELIMEKLRNDTRLKQAVEGGVRILKFRHVRRLSADRSVQGDHFSVYLDLDPLEYQDPQIRLL